MLQDKYKSLQRKFHPDTLRSKSKVWCESLHNSTLQEEQVSSSNHSAAINHAYNVLKTPHLRAQYLVHIVISSLILTAVITWHRVRGGINDNRS